jgi:hypothetical protein
VDGAAGEKGANHPPSGGHEETGKWRLEISPSRPAPRDCFLTVLHAGLKEEKPPVGKVRFDINRSAGYTALRILTEPGDSCSLLSVRFHDEGTVEVAAEAGGSRLEHRSPPPERVPRRKS